MNKIDNIKIQDFIKNFNEDFKCNISSETTSFLIELYRNFIAQNTTSKTQTKYINKLISLEEKIAPSLNQTQKTIFKNFDKAKDELWTDITAQAFVEGYCVCELLHNINNTTNK